MTLQVLDAKNEQPATAEFALPTLEAGAQPVNSRVGFESQTFPPRGWDVRLLPGNVCRPDPVAALTDSRGLLCQDLQSGHGTLIRAGLRFALPVDRVARPPDVMASAGRYPARGGADGQGPGDSSLDLPGRRRCGGCRLPAEDQER